MSWAITAAVVMGATTAYSIDQQNKAAVAQQEQINAQTQMNYNLKQQQEQEAKAATGMDLTQEVIRRNAERGKIKVAQAESGVAGISPLRELSNSYMQQSFSSGTIVAKGEATQRSLALDNLSTYLTSVNQWNQAESTKHTGLDAMLRIGASSLQGYSMAGGFSSAGAATTTTQTATEAGYASTNFGASTGNYYGV